MNDWNVALMPISVSASPSQRGACGGRAAAGFRTATLESKSTGRLLSLTIQTQMILDK